jgi:benzoyl-CoA 2,3-dioxygenase component A
MEGGVDAELSDIGSAHGIDWTSLKPQMRAEGRYHVETY